MRMQQAEDKNIDRIHLALATLERELIVDRKPLPAIASVELNATDDDIYRAIDFVALSNILRAGSGKTLRHSILRPTLIRMGRTLGLEIDGRVAKISDLRQRLITLHISGLIPFLDAIIEIALWDTCSPIDGKFDGQLFENLCHIIFERCHLDEVENVKACAQNVQCIALSLIDEFQLSTSFSGRLRGLLRRSDLNISTVASRSGISASTLRNWLDGHLPRPSNRNNLIKMAEVLNISPRLLMAGLDYSPAMVSHSALNEDVRADLLSTGIPIDFLEGGDFSEWPMERRIDFVYDSVIGGTAYSQYDKAIKENSIKYSEMNDVMQREWDEIEDFKTSSLPDPTFPRSKIVDLGNGLRKVFGGSWRSTSAELVNRKIRQSLFFAERAIVGEYKDSTTSIFNECGLGILAVIKFHRIALKEIAERRYELMKSVEFFEKTRIPEPRERLVFSYADIHRLYLISGLFSEETGWFFHHPPHFKVIPGLCDEFWVAQATSDWSGEVKKLQNALGNMIANVRKSATLIRDPTAPIAGLIALDDPLSPIFAALKQMNQDRPSASGNLSALARHDRKFLIASLVVHTRLRRANYSKLTYLHNNNGHLRRRENRWVLAIPRGELKNEHTTAIAPGSDLELELDHQDDLLNLALERWLGKVDESGRVNQSGSSRNFLHGANCGKKLFPGNTPEGEMAAAAIGALFRQFVTYYLAECPWRKTGLVNVYPFGIHAIRHLVVTFTLKKGGSFFDAARMIWDTVETVKKRYAHFTNIDRSRANNDFLRRNLS